MKNVTLLFLLKSESNQILLAMKKRGFGAGKWNGTGGKIETGESVEAATVRETQEEIGVSVREEDLHKVAEISFSFEGKPDWNIFCSAFTTTKWEGEPTESDEMAPQWFSLDAIPYKNMWIDDELWLPLVLTGKILKATFHFTSEGDSVLSQSIQEVDFL